MPVDFGVNVSTALVLWLAIGLVCLGYKALHSELLTICDVIFQVVCMPILLATAYVVIISMGWALLDDFWKLVKLLCVVSGVMVAVAIFALACMYISTTNFCRIVWRRK